MKIKFNVVLIWLFIIFSIVRLTFVNDVILKSKEDNLHYEKTLGDLRFYLTEKEDKKLRKEFKNILDYVKDKKALDTDKKEDDEENIFSDEAFLKMSKRFNIKLNEFTKRKITTSKDEIKESSETKTIDDSYLEKKSVEETFIFDEEKLNIQKEEIKVLKEILTKEDFNALVKIVDKMNIEKNHLSSEYKKDISDILVNYKDIPANLILAELTGKFKVLAYYEIEDGKIVKKDLNGVFTPPISSKESENYKKLVNLESLLLDVLYGKYFEGFFIFDDKEKGLISYASDFQNKKMGYLGIDPNDFKAEISNDFEKTRFYHSVINELSKVILLGSDEIDYTKKVNSVDVDNLEILKDLLKKDSYLKQFYVRFWDDYLYNDSNIASMGKETNRTLFFQRHQDEFINKYVSTDPFKDIIESMTYFILEDKPLDSSIKSEKIRFFYEFEKFKDLKERINLNINHINSGNY